MLLIMTALQIRKPISICIRSSSCHWAGSVDFAAQVAPTPANGVNLYCSTWLVLPRISSTTRAIDAIGASRGMALNILLCMVGHFAALHILPTLCLKQFHLHWL